MARTKHPLRFLHGTCRSASSNLCHGRGKLNPLRNPATLTQRQYFTHERGTYMGLYAFFLAGSNYLAPVICGFIAQYQGWRWVFYYPSIFVGCAITFLFFFCEETNYVRVLSDEPSTGISTKSPKFSSEGEKDRSAAVDMEAATRVSIRSGYTKKSYMKKLALWGPSQEQNTLFRRFWQCLYYLSWPVIFYAGYGCNVSG
jgi:MFS family permease